MTTPSKLVIETSTSWNGIPKGTITCDGRAVAWVEFASPEARELYMAFMARLVQLAHGTLP